MSNSNSKERIVFLFGSGISIGAGMPKFYEITERVLSGKGIYYDSSSEIFTSHKPHQNDLARTQEENARRVVEFIHRLKPEIEYYYKKHRFKIDTNYEDFYYMARQIHDSEAGEYDSPAVQPLVNKIFPDIKPLLMKTSTKSKLKWTISKLAEVAMNYIEYVVFRELKKETKSLDYLGCIKEAYEDRNLSRVNIFTLNHDTVLEQYLRQNDIQFTDGFFKPEGEEHRYWNPNLFSSAPFKVRLFKLHGSINWFRFSLVNSTDWTGESIIIPSGMENYLITDSKGRLWRALDKRPMLLVGTYNKMLEYLSGIYTELHCQFYHSLSSVRQLIICGYGLGDRGINTQIVDWLYSSDNHRIIVIDPNPETLKNKYLSSISNKWNKLLCKNKLRILSQGIEKTSWKELRGILREFR